MEPSGFLRFDDDASPALRSEWLALLPLCNNRNVSFISKRFGGYIPLEKVPTSAWVAAFPAPVRKALHAAMRQPAVLQAQRLMVKPHAGKQDIHRDHKVGAGVTANLAFTVSGRRLQTELWYGSHRGPAPLVPVTANSSFFMFDAYMLHRGAANASADAEEDRMFLIIGDLADTEALRAAAVQSGTEYDGKVVRVPANGDAFVVQRATLRQSERMQNATQRG